MKSYQVEKPNADGEAELVSRFKYQHGRPKQYRFNGQTGQFNIGGETPLFDAKGKLITSLTFTPMAFRVFTDTLFGEVDTVTKQPKYKEWSEFFFVDEKNCVSSILFSGTSLSEFFSIADPLYYDDKNILEVTLTAEVKKIEKGDKKWFLCKWSYKDADPEEVKAYRDFIADYCVFRSDTLTENGVMSLEAGTNFTQLVKMYGTAIEAKKYLEQGGVEQKLLS